MMKIVLSKYGIPSETVNSILIIYKKTRSMVRSSDGDTMDSLDFTISKSKSSRYPAVSITDADYADDIALTTNDLSEANNILLLIEEKANE